jgi:hypothetical protein
VCVKGAIVQNVQIKVYNFEECNFLMWSHKVTQFCIYYLLLIYLWLFTTFIFYIKTGNMYIPGEDSVCVRARVFVCVCVRETWFTEARKDVQNHSNFREIYRRTATSRPSIRECHNKPEVSLGRQYQRVRSQGLWISDRSKNFLCV